MVNKRQLKFVGSIQLRVSSELSALNKILSLLVTSMLLSLLEILSVTKVT